MSANLTALQSLLREDPRHVEALRLLASLDGDAHELDLLHRREVVFIGSGRDLTRHELSHETRLRS